MKMDKRLMTFICVIAAAAVLTILIVLASRPESTAPQGQYESQAVIEEVSSGDDTQPKMTHFYKQYSDTFFADTYIPDPINDSIDSLYAVSMPFDEKLLLDTLMPGLTTTRETSSFEDNVVYSAENERRYMNIAMKNGAACGNVYYGDYAMNVYKFPTENFLTRYEYAQSANMLPLYETVYKADRVGFMSREDAIAEVKTVLDRLSISVSDDVEIYAIDCKTLQEYQDKLMQEELESTIVNYDIKEQFTEADEFYIMCFTAEHNGIPITKKYSETPDYTRVIDGTNIKVYLTAGGITLFKAGELYQIQGVAEVNNTFITPQQAIEIASQEYNSIIQDSTVTVTEVSLEYCPTAYNDNYAQVKLIPVWSITLNTQMPRGRVDYFKQMICVNAVTGDII